MKISINVIRGGNFAFEVLPTTFISEIKLAIAERLRIPVHQQELLLLGTALADEQTVQSYSSIENGTQLNLDPKKVEGLYEVSLKYYKEVGMTEAEAIYKANSMLMLVEKKYNIISWHEIDWLTHNCVWHGCGYSSLTEIDYVPVGEDIKGL